MPRTPNLSYRINGGTLTDISTHGFHLVKSDDRITAPIKPYEEQKYPESSASEIYPHTVKDTANTNVYKITPTITSGTLTWTLTLV